jgi:hypothetical protein
VTIRPPTARASRGDFDYEGHASAYAAQRRAAPRIAACLHAALGPARCVINVGAGAGSYEPVDRYGSHRSKLEFEGALRLILVPEPG